MHPTTCIVKLGIPNNQYGNLLLTLTCVVLAAFSSKAQTCLPPVYTSQLRDSLFISNKIPANLGDTVNLAYAYPSAIAPDGRLYVAYTQMNGLTKIRYYLDDIWYDAGTFNSKAGQLTMAVSADGVPYVAYQDGTNNLKLTAQKYSNGRWEVVGTAGISTGYVFHPFISIAPDGTPYVIYEDAGTAPAISGKATVQRFSNGSWQAVGNAAFTADRVNKPVLAFNTDGTPYIAYQDAANNYQASVLRYSADEWRYVGQPGFSIGITHDIALAIDPSGTPYVAYNTSDGRIVVQRFVNGNWQTLEDTKNLNPTTLTKDYGFYPDITITSDGTPYVIYGDRYNHALNVQRYVNNKWELLVKFSTQQFGQAGQTRFISAIVCWELPSLCVCLTLPARGATFL